MSFIQEFALLFAVAAPVGAIAGMNLMLVLGGERGTLLLPAVGAFPTGSGPLPKDATSQGRNADLVEGAANDDLRRVA
ncbi:MAG: hypothetical protein ACREMO_04285 [Gemmatimonadales bacterium]